jgi:hypothetical protein
MEEMEGVVSLVQTSQRNSPPSERTKEKRTVRTVRSPRLARAATIEAAEIDGIRAFGTESELIQVQSELAVRQEALRRDIELTWENMRLGAVQGIVTDADASELFNWFTFWGVSQPAEVDFDLDNGSPASGALMRKCDQVVTAMRNAAQGAWVGSTRVVGLCGSAFWRDLIAHPEIHALWERASQYGDSTGLRALMGPGVGTPIEYGGIIFVRYWGTEDDSTVAVGADKCKFFPIAAPGVFQVVRSPGEFFGTVNRPGLDLYARNVMDPNAQGRMDQAAWLRTELYSYPLYYCTRPLMLQRAKRT